MCWVSSGTTESSEWVDDLDNQRCRGTRDQTPPGAESQPAGHKGTPRGALSDPKHKLYVLFMKFLYMLLLHLQQMTAAHYFLPANDGKKTSTTQQPN